MLPIFIANYSRFITAPENTPIILLHGNDSNSYQWLFFKYYMKLYISNPIFSIDINNTKNMEECKDTIDAAIHELNLNSKSIIIIGNSFGGLVGGEYAADPLRKRVSKLITISTPWNGSPAADLLLNPDTFPNNYFITNSAVRNNLIKRLQHNKTRIYTYSSSGDYLVNETSGILETANYGLLDSKNNHWSTMIDTTLIKYICTNWI